MIRYTGLGAFAAWAPRVPTGPGARAALRLRCLRRRASEAACAMLPVWLGLVGWKVSGLARLVPGPAVLLASQQSQLDGVSSC